MTMGDARAAQTHLHAGNPGVQLIRQLVGSQEMFANVIWCFQSVEHLGQHQQIKQFLEGRTRPAMDLKRLLGEIACPCEITESHVNVGFTPQIDPRLEIES